MVVQGSIRSIYATFISISLRADRCRHPPLNYVLRPSVLRTNLSQPLSSLRREKTALRMKKRSLPNGLRSERLLRIRRQRHCRLVSLRVRGEPVVPVFRTPESVMRSPPSRNSVKDCSAGVASRGLKDQRDMRTIVESLYICKRFLVQSLLARFRLCIARFAI